MFRSWHPELTHRQFLAWMAWLQVDWERPELTEYYLMGVMCEIRRVLSKHPNKIQPSQFELKFQKQESKSLTKQNKALRLKSATQVSKARWQSMVGGTVRTVRWSDIDEKGNIKEGAVIQVKGTPASKLENNKRRQGRSNNRNVPKPLKTSNDKQDTQKSAPRPKLRPRSNK